MNSKENKGNGGNGEEIRKPKCKTVNFKLILTLHFEHGKSETLKTRFNSKPDNAWCNIPYYKDLNQAYNKLLKKWRKTGDKRKIINKNTQIISTIGNTNCANCKCNKNIIGTAPCGINCTLGLKNPCCKGTGTPFDGGCACCYNG